MGKFRIVTIGGDGIGPEVVSAARRILGVVADEFGHAFEFAEALAGGIAIEERGDPLPPETFEACARADAVLLGAVGGPRWDGLPGDKRPERALMDLRGGLKLYTNLRPAKYYPALRAASPLRPEWLPRGFDIMVVRELTGGIYFGPRGRRHRAAVEEAFDTEVYSVREVERIARRAFDLARERRRAVTSVDKANMLESSRLWRETVAEVARGYPDVSLENMLVDAAAMQLIRNPASFDVILTTNMFGDILTDEAGALTGSIGLLPSASLGDGNFGLYEPIHGSAPDIAGKGMANPVGTVLSAAMMLRYSFGMEAEAAAVEKAVAAVFDAGFRTVDVASGGPSIGTEEMTGRIEEEVRGEG
jgi:3-isopropylmalate dehydrogenase